MSSLDAKLFKTVGQTSPADTTTYNTQQTFTNTILAERAKTLVVDANGGSVTVEYQHGSTWIAATEPITVDSVHELFIYKTTVRITPAGGATYSVI